MNYLEVVKPPIFGIIENTFHSVKVKLNNEAEEKCKFWRSESLIDRCVCVRETEPKRNESQTVKQHFSFSERLRASSSLWQNNL